MSKLNSEPASQSSDKWFVAVAERHRIEIHGMTFLVTQSEAGPPNLDTIVQHWPTPALLSGVSYGPVNFDVRLVGIEDFQPDAATPEESSWVSCEIIGPVAFAGASQTPGIDVPEFHLPSGRYSIRITSVGADANHDLAVDHASQTITVEFVRDERQGASLTQQDSIPGATSNLPTGHPASERRDGLGVRTSG